MRFTIFTALAVIAAPVLAQDGVSYDDSILDACLNDRMAEHAQTDIEGEPLRLCIGQAAVACMQGPDGDTTYGMGECLSRETRQWDMLLNAWYDKALNHAESADADLADMGSAAPKAAPALRAAQRNWIAYRDKSCEFEAVRHQGGTMGGPASADCMLQLTATQALRLRDITAGME
ncbi:DUF1311 domain-containing protein [Paracoccus sp. DMF-8]|uniref:lysozyme inhibitor LprI family protein n=1 Tax=Paracoccus sp. DMF-8 TaxID=3019445 RepID=UPI0023E8291B|nr:DUF1311 domain-containing protein [Paracoccus sp. DMF-8]MDF3606032.1 DUF1311 domain-containing protein [Paracoccus sp. DMF-8]